MLRRCSAAGFLILAGLALPAHGQAPLQWKLKKGDQFYVRTVTTYRQTFKAAGKPDLKQNFEKTVVLGFTVEDQNADGLVLKETIEDISEKRGEGEARPEDAVRGRDPVAFTVTLSPKMEVLKVEGQDKLIDRLAGADVSARKALTSALSEETVKKSAREVFGFLPDRPVKEGGTWERAVDVPFGPLGAHKLTTTYKLEGKEDVGGKKVEKISFTTAVDFKPGKADPSLPYAVVGSDLKADDSRGTLHFDAAAGRLVQSEAKMTLKGHLVLASGGSNTDADVEQDQVTKVTLLNDNPVKR
jgi:hypothetical protein